MQTTISIPQLLMPTLVSRQMLPPYDECAASRIHPSAFADDESIEKVRGIGTANPLVGGSNPSGLPVA